jgi:hypothetical protein
MQDKKVLDVLSAGGAGNVPLASTSFNTGYIETASILVAAAAALESLRRDIALWPQKTGIAELDNRNLSSVPRHVMALASSDCGYNFAVILKTGSFIS